jgi:hypothetical protein
VRISSNPLILLFPAFVTPEQCATLLEMAQQASSDEAVPGITAETAEGQRLIESIEARLGGITSCPPHEMDEPLIVKHTKPDHGAHNSSRFPIGLHVDVGPFASAILYLSTPTSGGQTIFPLADSADDKDAANGLANDQRAAALEASRQLLQDGVTQTFTSRSTLARTLEAAAVCAPSTFKQRPQSGTLWRLPVFSPRRQSQSLEDRPPYVASQHGIAVRAKAGNLLVFWSYDASAGLDAHSWHAGEAVGRSSIVDKWFLFKAKRVPRGATGVAARREFIERSRLAGLRRRFSILRL